MQYGVCCIVLDLEEKETPKKFQRITYKRFSQLPRELAVKTLSERILNNIDVTYHAIKYCHENNFCYRLSSDLFPLLTYDKANVSLEELPDYNRINYLFNKIKEYLKTNPTRVSSHPGEYTTLASKNEDAVKKTIKELNFYSDFMDKIGCPANHNAPMNFHVHNNDGSNQEVVERFMKNFDLLDKNCKSRITIENDDKLKCWSVNQLINDFNSIAGIPICFDYLHHKCHPDNLSEQDAIAKCYETWPSNTKPLFHYSEGKEDNPRAHADYPKDKFNNYGLDFDVDFEFKMKDRAIQHFLKCK